MLSLNKSLLVAALTSCLLVRATIAFQNGDLCGVSSSDFLTYDFRSDYLVAGKEGCDLGQDSNCYCAPNLQDGESLSEWKWQCNNSVKFGPSSGDKICPESVPVGKGLGELEAVLNRRVLSAEQERVSCDTAVNPTGRPGDEFCSYSDCDQGGDHSAICACVDLQQYGLGNGMEWICMHATCSCGEDNANEPTNTSKAAIPWVSPFSAVSMLIVFFMACY